MNRLAEAKTLFQSIKDADPLQPFSFYVLTIDGDDGVFGTSHLFERLTLQDLDSSCPHLRRMSFQYSAQTFSLALKPFLLRFLLLERKVQSLLFLDSQTLVLSTMSEIFRALDESPLLLVPHVLEPLPEGNTFPYRDILVSGCFNLGFLGLAQSECAIEFLNWWSRHIERQCLSEPLAGLFVEQRCTDLVPALFPKACILRSRALGIAVWNLHERALSFRSNSYWAGEMRAIFFQFTGFEKVSLEPFQDSISHRLYSEYVQKLKANGQPVYENLPAGLGSWNNGIRIPPLAREMFRATSGWLRFQDPLNSSAPDSYFSWLFQGQAESAPRLLHEIWNRRGDLQNFFPDPHGQDRKSFLRWAANYGVQEHNLDPKLAPLFLAQASDQTFVETEQDQS